MTSRRERSVCSDALRLRTPAPTRDRSRARSYRSLAVIAAAAMVLTACGSDDAAPEASNEPDRGEAVAVAGTDRLRFDPDEFTIPVGEEVSVALTAGSVEHDFVVEAAARYGTAEAGHEADNPDDLHVAHADEGETVRATFTIERPGTYTVYCSVPGHRDAGMVATLEVTDAQG